VVVIGAGQSAAEITRYIHDTVEDADVFAVTPSSGYARADDTPFVNEIFDASAVDHYYNGSESSKDAIWHYHRNSNYSVVDDELIKELYRRSYNERIEGNQRLNFLGLTTLHSVEQREDSVRVVVFSTHSQKLVTLEADLLICATGYLPMDPTDMLGDLAEHCVRDDVGRLLVRRDYRLVTKQELPYGIYLQGGTEHTHGISSSLLSNVAVRSGEIASSILNRSRSRSSNVAVSWAGQVRSR
jgi:L-ornithine N5-monooxygenase